MALPKKTFKNVRVRVKYTVTTGEGPGAVSEDKSEEVEVGRLLSWFIQNTAFRGVGRPEK